MTESPPPTALGKRAHDGEEDGRRNETDTAGLDQPTGDVDMSDDDDVGPMPMSDAAAPRKKRKGEWLERPPITYIADLCASASA